MRCSHKSRDEFLGTCQAADEDSGHLLLPKQVWRAKSLYMTVIRWLRKPMNLHEREPMISHGLKTCNFS